MLKISCYRCSHCQKLFETKEAYKEHLLDIADEIVNILNSFIRDASELGIRIVQRYDILGRTISFRVVTEGEDNR